MSASNPLAPDIVEACAQALARAERILDPHHLYPELATACIRAFLANWRPEVSDAAYGAALAAYHRPNDDAASLETAWGRAIKRALDTMLAEARGV